jgi:Protein of unknown function (DUF3551)
MRSALVGLALLISSGLAYSQPSYTSSEYCDPWCHAYRDGSLSCAYHSFEQCLASRSGIGGDCVPNPFLSQCRRAPDAGHRLRHPSRSKAN